MSGFSFKLKTWIRDGVSDIVRIQWHFYVCIYVGYTLTVLGDDDDSSRFARAGQLNLTYSLSEWAHENYFWSNAHFSYTVNAGWRIDSPDTKRVNVQGLYYSLYLITQKNIGIINKYINRNIIYNVEMGLV